MPDNYLLRVQDGDAALFRLQTGMRLHCLRAILLCGMQVHLRDLRYQLLPVQCVTDAQRREDALHRVHRHVPER
jgi:hypothetical protein